MHDRILVDLADSKSEATDDELCELLNVAKDSSTMKSAVRPQEIVGGGLLTTLTPLLTTRASKAFPIIEYSKNYGRQSMHTSSSRSTLLK
jgi:hypothetical protein